MAPFRGLNTGASGLKEKLLKIPSRLVDEPWAVSCCWLFQG